MSSVEEQLHAYAEAMEMARKSEDPADALAPVVDLSQRPGRRRPFLQVAAAVGLLAGAAGLAAPTVIGNPATVDTEPPTTTTATSATSTTTTTVEAPEQVFAPIDRARILGDDLLRVLPGADWTMIAFEENDPQPDWISSDTAVTVFDVGAGSTLFVRSSDNPVDLPDLNAAEIRTDFNRTLLSWRATDRQIDLIGFDVAIDDLSAWASGMRIGDDGFATIPGLTTNYTGRTSNANSGSVTSEFAAIAGGGAGDLTRTVRSDVRAGNLADLYSELGEASGGGTTKPISVGGQTGFTVEEAAFSYAIVQSGSGERGAVTSLQSYTVPDLTPFLQSFHSATPDDWAQAVDQVEVARSDAAASATADVELEAAEVAALRLPRYLLAGDDWKLLAGHDRSTWTESQIRTSVAGLRAQRDRASSVLTHVQILRRTDRPSQIEPDVLIQTWEWKPDHPEQWIRPEGAQAISVGSFDGWLKSPSKDDLFLAAPFVHLKDGLTNVRIASGTLTPEELRSFVARLEVNTGEDSAALTYSSDDFALTYSRDDPDADSDVEMTWGLSYIPGDTEPDEIAPQNRVSIGSRESTAFAEELYLARQSAFDGATFRYDQTFEGYPIIVERRVIRSGDQQNFTSFVLEQARTYNPVGGYTISTGFSDDPAEVFGSLRRVGLDEWTETASHLFDGPG